MRAALIVSLFGAAIAAPVAQDLAQASQLVKGVAPALSNAADLKDTPELLSPLQQKRAQLPTGSLPVVGSALKLDSDALPAEASEAGELGQGARAIPSAAASVMPKKTESSLPIVGGLLGGAGSLPIKRQLPALGGLTGGLGGLGGLTGGLTGGQKSSKSKDAGDDSVDGGALNFGASSLPIGKRQLPALGGLTGGLGGLGGVTDGLTGGRKSAESPSDAAEDSTDGGALNFGASSLPIGKRQLPALGGLTGGLGGLGGLTGGLTGDKKSSKSASKSAKDSAKGGPLNVGSNALPIGKRQLPGLGGLMGGKKPATPVKDTKPAIPSAARSAIPSAARSAVPSASNLPPAAEGLKGLPVVGSLLGGGLGKRQLPALGGITGGKKPATPVKDPKSAVPSAAKSAASSAANLPPSAEGLKGLPIVGSLLGGGLGKRQLPALGGIMGGKKPATPVDDTAEGSAAATPSSQPKAAEGLPIVGSLLGGGLKPRQDLPIVGKLLKSVSNGKGGAIPLPARRVRRGDLGMQCVGSETGDCRSTGESDSIVDKVTEPLSSLGDL